MHFLILGGSRDARRRAAEVYVPRGHAPFVLDAATLPFRRVTDVALPSPPRCLLVPDIDRAFPDAQAGGTRLVLTQSTYLVQTWIDRLDEGDRIVATADRAALRRGAPEALRGRGAWRNFETVDLGTEDTKGESEQVFTSASPVASAVESAAGERVGGVEHLLLQAYASTDQAERLRLCREAIASAPESAVAWIALASACRETRDGAGARDALDRAAALAPDWAAAAYERGKLSLVYDDLPLARDAFQRAALLMPTFSAAFSNLGATLGELGSPEAALDAFRQVLIHDPDSFTILNNIGASCRELGRFDESAAALRRVVAIEPDFVFGHYNLGRTLFLAGSFRDALGAYEEGQRRDPETNRRQGCRLAVVRLANGDAEGAERDLWRMANAAPTDEREDLLLEAYETAHALLTQHTELAVHRSILARIGAEIVKSE